ncbi:MAG: oligonucleotide/oligosaccharide-binding-fold domain-containing protein, partial [Bullifex sp.]
IEHQLEEIVGAMGIPITSGGSVSDYLTCLASGLIQYVCYQYSRGVYRSLSATQIYIHPSSSWFTTAPKFLLAGEIVKTSRMFARTVSPLDESTLRFLGRDLVNELVKNKKQQKQEAKEEAKKPQGSFVRIFDRDYPVKQLKKKQVAAIPLTDLPYLIKAGFERGSVKKVNVVLKHDKAVMRKPVKLRDLIQEGGIIRTDSVISKGYQTKTVNASTAEVLAKELDNLFRPVCAGDMLMFVGLRFLNGDSYQFRCYSAISNMVDDTYYALSELAITSSDRKLKKKAEALKEQIDTLVDFSAE